MKQQIHLILALAGTLLAGCGKQPPVRPGATAEPPALAAKQESEEKVLNIRAWPGQLPADVLEEFEDETGIKVTYAATDSYEALHRSLEGGHSGDDLVFTGGVYSRMQVEKGLLATLDKSKLKNLQGMGAAPMQLLARTDAGNAHLVPWSIGFVTVGIHAEKVAAALGDTPMPSSALDLVFKPALTSKLKSCGIAMIDAPLIVMPAALQYLGKSPYSQDENDLTAAADVLSKVRGDIAHFDSSAASNLARGRSCVALDWSGSINRAAKDSRSIQALTPQKDAIAFVESMAIPRGARHPGNAHTFINHVLKAQNAARISTEMRLNMGNEAAIKLLPRELSTDPSLTMESSRMSSLIVPQAYTSVTRAAVISLYARTVYGLSGDFTEKGS